MKALQWSLIGLLLTGCAGAPREALPRDSTTSTQSATTQLATTQSAKTQAANALPARMKRSTTQPSVSSKDFDALWKACEKALHARHFRIDRRDYRGGLITTFPLISKQFFEIWRTDALGVDDVAESSLNTIRRTVRIEIEHDDTTGVYTAIPHVEIERYSTAGRRLTSAATYRSAFKRTDARGTRESDAGILIPGRYWYSLGNDERLEAALAKSMRNRLQ